MLLTVITTRTVRRGIIIPTCQRCVLSHVSSSSSSSSSSLYYHHHHHPHHQQKQQQGSNHNHNNFLSQGRNALTRESAVRWFTASNKEESSTTTTSTTSSKEKLSSFWFRHWTRPWRQRAGEVVAAGGFVASALTSLWRHPLPSWTVLRAVVDVLERRDANNNKEKEVNPWRNDRLFCLAILTIIPPMLWCFCLFGSSF